MRILLIHSDQISYEALKKTPVAEETLVLTDGLEEALTAFCAVEALDEENIPGVAAKTAAEILDAAQKLGTKNIMIYPYAHLSNDLSSPKAAVQALTIIEEICSQAEGMTVKRAPFGWYKAFTLSCKGHPLSELSRTITPEDAEEKAEKKKVTHTFFVMTPEGAREEPAKYADNTPFGKLVAKETGTAAEVSGDSIHCELMRAKELVDYEPLSDVGNHRWMPRERSCVTS